MATFTDQTNSVDTQMSSGAPTTSYGSDSNITVGADVGGTPAYRSLIKWDLSSIPTGATVISAVLSIYVLNDFSDNARTIHAYRVLRAWVEAQVTWNVFSTGNNWGTAGCSNTSSDREATDIGTGTVTSTQSVGDEIQITLTPAKVQEWIDGTLTNNGVLLKVDTEDGDNMQYASHENATSDKRPKLVITYSLPGGSLFYSQI